MTAKEEEVYTEESEEEQSAEEQPAEEEQPESGVGEESEEQEPEGEEEEPSKKKGNRAEKRIRELTRKYRQTERELQELRALLRQQGRDSNEAGQQPSQPQPPKKPTREQFDDEDEFFEALADWKADQKAREREQQQEQSRRKQEQQQEQERFNEAISQINQQGYDTFGDEYEDIVMENSELVVTDDMARSIAEMDQGHLVAYHLGNNPDKAAEIAKKTPYRQAIELSKLEAQLGQKPQKKKKTGAPPPTNPVKGGKGEGADPEPSDPDEWMKWRRRQIQKQRGG